MSKSLTVILNLALLSVGYFLSPAVYVFIFSIVFFFSLVACGIAIVGAEGGLGEPVKRNILSQLESKVDDFLSFNTLISLVLVGLHIALLYHIQYPSLAIGYIIFTSVAWSYFYTARA